MPNQSSNSNKILNLIQKVNNKRGLLTISVVLIVASLFGVNYLWLNGTFGINPFKNRTEVVINGGSLGAVSAAIQLSDLGKSFILIEPGDMLGGQATTQGVSTFDQHNRPFQYNKLYSEILQSFQPNNSTNNVNGKKDVVNVGSRGDTFSIDYWGNAITGPGSLPKQIADFLESRIDERYGRVIYNSEVIETLKIGNKIDSVLIKNHENQKTQRLQANLFLDGSDYSQISRFAGVPFNFGMDTQERTGEKLALTKEELDIFEEGVATDKEIIGGYGNRLQPITTPFAMLDKGYNGNRYSASRLAGFANTGRDENSNSSGSELKPKPCPQIQFQCLEIASGQNLEFEYRQPQIGLQEVNLVFVNDLQGTAWLNNITLQLDDKTFSSSELISGIYQVERVEKQKYTILKFPFNAKNSTIKLSLTNTAGESLYLSELIVSPIDKQVDIQTGQQTKTLASTKEQIQRVQKFETNFDKPNQKKGNTYGFNLENFMLDQDKTYYANLIFPENLDFEKYSRRLSVNVFEEGNKIFDAVIDPNNTYFDGYFPFYKFTKNNGGKGLSFSFVGLDGKEPPIQSLSMVPADQVTTFEILRDKESIKYEDTALVDIVSVGNITNLGISLQKNLKEGKDRPSLESLIKASKEDEKSIQNTRTRFIARQFINQGDTIAVNSESKASQVLLVKASPAHYFNQIYNNFDPIKDNLTADGKKIQSYFYPSDTGKFQLLARVKPTDNQADEVAFTLRLANQPELAKTITFKANEFQTLGFIEVNQDTVNFRLEPKCSGDCLQNLEIILTEELPPEYDAEFFSRKVTYRPGEKQIFSEGSIVNDFFRFRRILDPFNFFKNSQIPNYIKSRVNFNSLGVSQINTGYNDLEMFGVDPKKMLSDSLYREGVEYRSRLLSAQYFYWLKYDAPTPLLGCEDSEPFCSGLRLGLSGDAMGTGDGIANNVYVRDPVRPIGQKQLTFNDISVVYNPCQKDDSEQSEVQDLTTEEIEQNCVKLKLDGVEMTTPKEFLQKFSWDSIGTFYYPTDIHGLVQEIKPFNDYLISEGYRTQENLPDFIFGLYDSAVKAGTIDLGNIFSDKVDNLLFCGKNLSVSQIANGSTRLHPAEVAVGQACGSISAYMLENKTSSVNQLNNQTAFGSVQQKLVQDGAILAPLDDNELFTLKREKKWEVLLAYYRTILGSYLEADVSQDNVDQFVLLKLLPNKKATNQDVQKMTSKLGWQTPNDIPEENSEPKAITLGQIIELAPEEAKDKITNSVQFHQEVMKEVGLSKGSDVNDDYELTRGDLAMIIGDFV